MAYPAPTATYAGPVAHHSGSGNLPATRIVIHCTAGSDATGAPGTASWFRNPDSRGSAHYICDNRVTLRCTSLDNICWHAPPNSRSVGVELCCSLANKGLRHWTQSNHVAMLKRGATLTAELCLYLNIPAVKLTVAQVRAGQKGICGHIDVSNAFGQSSHWDPGPYFPWSTFMAMVRAEVARLTHVAPPPPPPPPPVKEWDEMATQAQVQAACYAANSEYAINFWVAPTGTGTALRNAVAANGRAIAALGELIKAEDAADDAEFRAAMAGIAKANADLQTAVEALVTPPLEAPALPKA